MTHNIWIYIAVMAGVTFLIRVLPLTVIRKKIKNRFFIPEADFRFGRMHIDIHTAVCCAQIENA